MRSRHAAFALTFLCAALLGGLLAGCGTTPEPTEPPPTQTPWIIVVTATPGPEEVAEAQPTQTPWIVVATPTRDRRPTSTQTPESDVLPTRTPTATTPEPTATATAVLQTPTRTPTPEVLLYQAPVLLDPADGAPFSWGSTVLMEWTSVGELAEDEYYRLDLERPPQTETQKWYGDYVFTKDTEYLAEGAFLAPFHLPEEQGRAVVRWSVRVVRKTGEDEFGKPVGVDISQPSEKRTFVLDPKPSDA